MNFKHMLHKYMEKIKDAWNEGKIQRTSRITYDVFWNVILFFVIVGVIGAFFVGGLGAGYFASLVKDEPVRSYASMKQDIYNYEETSKLYFAGGNYFGNVRSDLHREQVSIDQVSDKLIHAVIATEDSNFKMHEGIVPKAIVRATIQQITNAPIQSGGSTLTQQLVKNQILTNEVSYERKAKEILIAMRVERFFGKKEILEAYLNIIPYGRNASGQNIAGIQTAAQGIFGIDASELNLPQAAFLAGLPQSPSYYTPFKNRGGLKSKEGLQPGLNRMKTVLERMHDAGYITKKEYEKALNYNIVKDFIEGSKSSVEKYPYLTYEAQERAKKIIREHLAKQDGYSMKELKKDDDLMEEYTALADRAMRQNGYKIHTTINKKIQDKFKQIVKNYDQYGEPWTGEVVVNYETGKTKTITQKVQTGGILIENSTGRIISFIGGRNFSQDNQINYTTRPRPNGSTMKPILDYAPAMELGVIQPGTPIADIPTTFHIPGSGSWSPSNYIQGSYHGIVSARKALANSYNIPAAKVYSRIVDQNPVKNFLIEKMGITSLTKQDQTNLSMSLGQPTHGISVEENTNAFSTFGNRGKFNDAYLIQKITTADGKVIYKHKKDPERVFSRQTNYLTIDMMRDVIDNGTATFLNSQLKYDYVDWAGKTGTSQGWEDTWFVGVNPKVTFSTWMGYKRPQSIRCSSCSLGYSNRNIKLWAELINAASNIKPDLVAPQKNFNRPSGIVSRSYCAISGKLPSDLCKQAGLIKTDLFNAKYAPTETGNSLIEGSYVMVDGQAVVAGPNTPAEFTQGNGLAFNPKFLERKGWDRLSDLSILFPRTNRDKWSKIGLPSSNVSSGSIEDDGKAPAAPSNVSVSGGTLTWSESGSSDVVGYRIYKASSPNGSYRKVGSTTGTSTSISGSGAYIVRAVDYFGMESSASKAAVSGKTGKSEKNNQNKPDKPAKTEKPENTGNGGSNNGRNGDSGNESNGNADNNNTGDNSTDNGGTDGGTNSGGTNNGGNGNDSTGGSNTKNNGTDNSSDNGNTNNNKKNE